MMDEDTHLLPLLDTGENQASANAFCAYLQQYGLHPLDVALTSRVRYLTVWNVERGNPISAEHAMRLRAGLHQLTGVLYTAPILLLAEEETTNHNHQSKPEIRRRRLL
jgi:hypothetical protein